MDNRFTKRRVVNMLSYDWGKIILIVLAVILIWSLAFTIGAPRASVGQTYGVFVYGNFTGRKTLAGELLDEFDENKVFSYDILNYTSRDMDDKTYGMLMQAMTGVYEGDIMIVSDGEAEQYDADKPENERGKGSAYKGLVDGYGHVICDIDKLIENAENYCLDIVQGVKDEDGKYILCEENIKKYFAKRMEKDPRFRKKDSDRYKQGVSDEIERIKAIWNNAQRLKYCLEKHPELRREYKRFEQNMTMQPEEYTPEKLGDEYDYYLNQEEKTYGINIGALSGGKNKISDLYGFDIEEDGKHNLFTDGVILCVFDYAVEQPDLQFESLGVINYLIENYSDFLENAEISALIL